MKCEHDWTDETEHDWSVCKACKIRRYGIAHAREIEKERDAVVALLRRIWEPWGHKIREDVNDTKPDWFDEAVALLGPRQ